MKVDVNPFVIDASMSLAWCFEEEKTPDTEWALDRVAEGAEVVVPAIWPLEILNVLLIAEQRKRLTTSQVDVFLEQLKQFAITVDIPPLTVMFDRIASEARRWRLTSYDAAYLELALRRGLPLATLDDRLKKAAKAMGVPVAHRAAGH